MNQNPPTLHPGDLILKFIQTLETQDIQSVYLRNYEDLPENIGHDVDLLIPTGTTSKTLELLGNFLVDSGWHILRAVEFGPLAVFVSSDDALQVIQLDLFERLDWHCIPFASPAAIIQQRVWNGTVHHPAPEDEIYLNVLTRLVYQGVIREKHRIQYVTLRDRANIPRLRDVFIRNLGHHYGNELLTRLESSDWLEIESSANKLRKSVVVRGLFKTPLDSSIGIISYFKRSIKRLLNPPGIFVVFEGADGVGKSSVIEKTIPSLIEMTGKSNLLSFHWKPCKASFRESGQEAGPTMNPRGKTSRGRFASILFLTYHWLGFWHGWFRYLRPALVKNRPVVGDRYSYEFFLDPARLRLSCPDWLLKLAMLSTPRPKLTIALIADPDTVCSRKQELTRKEILHYQERLSSCQELCSEITTISANASLDLVTDRAIRLVNTRFTTELPTGTPRE